MEPVEVSDESLGRLPSYLLAEGLPPTANFVLHGLFWLTLAILVVVVIDLFARGRFRNFSSALASMLGALGPLLGFYGAADILMSVSLDPRYTDISGVAVGPSALLVAAGTLCGCIGVVLTAVLKIIPAKHRNTLTESLDHPRATTR